MVMKSTIILLCSDAIRRTALEEVLEQAGYLVLPAKDIGGAVDWLIQCTDKPNLLIIDHYIAGMAGHDAALYLRRRCPGLKVLMVGGIVDDERLRYREEIQAFHVFPKPFAGVDLVATVSQILAQPVAAA